MALDLGGVWKVIVGSGQTAAVGAASVQFTNAVGSATYAIRITTLGNCHVAIGTNPTATANDLLLKSTDPAAVIGISPGLKVAIIQDGSATGNCNLVELTQ